MKGAEIAKRAFMQQRRGGLLMKEYTTKTVYVGIDVHKKSYSVTAVCDKQIVKKDRLAADPGLLSEIDDKSLGKKKVIALMERKLSNDLSFTLSKLCEEWLYLTEQIEKVKERLGNQAEEDPLEKIYNSLPGMNLSQ